jgi:2-hydroxychromene-2-carboxylate isomerase
MRLNSVEEASGVSFRWLPFSVRAIMIEQKTVPFVAKLVKMAYMWRDSERRRRSYGFEPQLPRRACSRNSTSQIELRSSPRPKGWCADYAPRGLSRLVS